MQSNTSHANLMLLLRMTEGSAQLLMTRDIVDLSPNRLQHRATLAFYMQSAM